MKAFHLSFVAVGITVINAAALPIVSNVPDIAVEINAADVQLDTALTTFNISSVVGSVLDALDIPSLVNTALGTSAVPVIQASVETPVDSIPQTGTTSTSSQVVPPIGATLPTLDLSAATKTTADSLIDILKNLISGLPSSELNTIENAIDQIADTSAQLGSLLPDVSNVIESGAPSLYTIMVSNRDSTSRSFYLVADFEDQRGNAFPVVYESVSLVSGSNNRIRIENQPNAVCGTGASALTAGVKVALSQNRPAIVSQNNGGQASFFEVTTKDGQNPSLSQPVYALANKGQFSMATDSTFGNIRNAYPFLGIGFPAPDGSGSVRPALIYGIQPNQGYALAPGLRWSVYEGSKRTGELVSKSGGPIKGVVDFGTGDGKGATTAIVNYFPDGSFSTAYSSS